MKPLSTRRRFPPTEETPGQHRPHRRMPFCIDGRARAASSMLLASALLLIPVLARAVPWSLSYAPLDRPSQSQSIPYPSQAYNDSGGDLVRAERLGTGWYLMHFNGLTAMTEAYGHVQVSATNVFTDTCQVASWSNDTVEVRCWDLAGVATDASFLLYYIKKKGLDKEMAYAWANDPTAASYMPSATYSLNPTGGSINSQRLAAGRYRVTFSGFGAVGSGTSHVQVGAYGSTPTRCKVDSWVGDSVDVRCFDFAGDPTDSMFNVLYLRPAAHRQGLSYTLVDQPVPFAGTIPAPAAFTHSAVGDSVNIEHWVAGDHIRVDWNGLAGGGAPGGIPMVTAYGQTNTWCRAVSWDGDTARVKCFDTDGNEVDGFFSVMFYRAPRGAIGQEYAFAWADRESIASYSPDEDAFYNSGGDTMQITRSGTGQYMVEWPGMSDIGDDEGAAFVTAHNGPAADADANCNVVNWGSSQANVRCFDASGAETDSPFNILYLKATQGRPGAAYAWAGSPSTSSYFADGTWAHNPANGNVVISRSSEGSYLVEWLDYLPEGSNGGTVLVSAYGSTGNRCSVLGWGTTTTDTQASVRCEAPSGLPADTAFSIAFLESAQRTDGIGYAWAQLPSNPSYSPLPAFSFNAADAGIQIDRLATGSYQVTFDDFLSEGNPDHRGHAQVVQYGAADGYCKIHDFDPGSVSVRCLNASGVPADRLFDVVYLRPTRVPEPGVLMGLLAGSAALVLFGRLRRCGVGATDRGLGIIPQRRKREACDDCALSLRAFLSGACELLRRSPG